jgi:hypothetical protein
MQAASKQRWILAGWVLWGALAVLMLATAHQVGLTWDEVDQRTYGDYVIAWYRSGFHDRSAFTYYDLYLYGGLFDVLAQLLVRVSPIGVYETRHLVNLAFALAGVAGALRLAQQIASGRAAFFTVALLALTPMFYGHAFNNPKDIPFATLFVWVLYYIVESARELPQIRPRVVAKLALVTGLLLGIRMGGIFVLSYIAVLWIAKLIPSRQWKRPTVAFACVCAGAWIVMLMPWPWGQVSPIVHPIRAIGKAARFRFCYDVLFNGVMVPARHVPWTYVPVWFGISLPEIYFVAWGLGSWATWRRWRSGFDRACAVEHAFLLFSILFPVVAAIVLHSTLYDAVRHLLFIVPPLAVLTASAMDRALTELCRPLRMAAATVALGSAALTARDMVQLHPYESVYFNRIIGGLKGAAGRFETDYWGQSYRAAMEWVVANIPGPVRVANCSNSLLSSYFIPPQAATQVTEVEPDQYPDIVLATTRWDCHKTSGGRVIHTIDRQGVPLAYVLDLRPTWEQCRLTDRPAWCAGRTRRAVGRLPEPISPQKSPQASCRRDP